MTDCNLREYIQTMNMYMYVHAISHMLVFRYNVHVITLYNVHVITLYIYENVHEQ